MAYNQLTPQERMQRAAQLRAMREARLGYTPTDDSLSRYLLPTERSVGVESVQPVQASQPTQQSSEGFDLGRWGATGLDVVSKVATVPFQFFEGIFDMGAGFIGNIGGWFSEEFKNEVEKVANFNATDEWLRKPMDEAGLKHSYLNEEGAGQFFDQIFDGVGQVGTVAALSLIPGFGTGAAIATMGASAGGGAMQEALSEGADLGEAMNYGVVSGAIEGGTEALLGGISLFGKGIAKGAKAVGKEVAEMGGKRILKGMVEEGAEEALATFASPLAKTTYKGVDAIGEYFEPEFYGDVLKDAASGALVSAAYGGTIGHALHQTGKDADISAAQESIKDLQKKRRSLQSTEEGLSDEMDAQIVESGRKNLENISKVLKDASPKQRAKLIERHRLAQAFDAEGNLKPDYALKAFGQASTAPDTQTGRVEEGQSADGRYYSADMRGREDVLQKDAESIQEALRAKPNQENATVELFRGELSEEGKKHLRETYGAMNTLSDLTPTGMSIALVDSDGGMDGVVLGNRIYLDYRVVEDGTFAKPLVEEVSHFSEGTETYADAIKFISADDVLRQGVYDALTGDGNAYGFTTELADRTIEKQKNGEKLTDEESTFARELNAHMSAEALGNETFMKKLVKGKPKLAEKLIARIKALQAALSKSETPEARTQRKRLAKAEKLWMQAVEDAGAKEMMKYFGANKEKEEEESVTRTNEEKVQDGESEVQFSLVGKSKDGRNIYKSNYPGNTPKAVKQAEIIQLVQEVWSKNPIELTIVDNGKERKITAKFNPELSERSDLSKIVFGNRKGNASEKRITLDLSSDLYHIAETSTYVRSKEEIGKDNPAHNGVLEWHYFVTNLIYEDFDGKKFDCHMNIDVKEKNDGTWFYSFAIEKGVAPQTLLAVVTEESATTPNDSIHQSSSKNNPFEQNSSEKVSTSGKAQFSLPAKPQSAGAKKSTATVQSEGQKFFLPGRSTADNARLGDVSRMNSERMQVAESVDNSEEMRYNETDFNDEMEAIDDAGEGTERNERLLVLRGRAGRLQLEKYEFSEDSFVLPNPGSIEANEQKTIADYGVESFVIKKTAWNRESLSETKNGRIYIREDIPQSKSGIVAPHELTHVMKQMQYPPYMELLSRTPDALDFSSIKTKNLLKGIAVFFGYDFYTATPEQFQQIYDKLNCTVYGHYAAGDSTNPQYAAQFRERISNNFKDFDSYIAELESIHKQFKADMQKIKGLDKRRGKGTQLATINQSQGMKYDETDFNDEKEAIDDDREGTPSKERGKLSQSESNNDGVRKAFGNRSGISGEEREKSERDKRVSLLRRETGRLGLKQKAFSKESFVTPKIGSAESYVQENIQEYGIESYVVNFNDWDRTEPATSKDGVIYVRENLPKELTRLIAPHEATHVMNQMKYQPYIDFLSRTPDMLDFSYEITEDVLKEVAAHCKLVWGEISADEFNIVYSELNSTIYGHYARGDAKNSEFAEEYNRTIVSIMKDYDSYISELDRIHKQFKEDMLEVRRTLDERDSTQFSPPEKKPSDGARANSNTDRGRSKTFTREDSAAVNAVMRNQEKRARLTRDIVFQAGKIKDLKLGKAHFVSEFNDPIFRNSIERLSAIARGGQLSVTTARKVFTDLAGWMGWINDVNGEAVGRLYDLQNIRGTLQTLSEGKGAFTPSELESIVIVLKGLRNYVETYSKIRRSGKLVDALPIAQAYLRNIERSNRIPRGLVRRMYESGFMGAYADPVTLMRYADLYTDGFFTDTFYEFREGAVKVAITRMELMESYNAFLKKHKNYADRLTKETVEFRGQKLPVGVAISLWMTSKRKQAQLGLVKAGAQYRIDPKDKKAQKAANGQKIFDVAPLGNFKEDYTQEELDQMMKDLRADIDAHLTDTDRAYIQTVEGIFSKCGEIKMEVDMRRLGYTNVDKDQYYFPIARANQATTIDTESWRAGLDRVSHLSMNKDTVKGAWSRLYIGGVDSILNRHVNQVAIYNGLAEAVDNFNVLVNLNTIENKGAAYSINDMVNRTDFGKAALDYLRKMKQDIEQVNRTELDDRGFVTKLARFRGAYASYQLGANPKVWITQLSSFIAAHNLLDVSSITRGIHLSASNALKEKREQVHRDTIVPGMTAKERYEVLKRKRIAPTQIQIAEGFDVDWKALERNRKSVVEKSLIGRLRELGFLKNYKTESIDIDFEFTAGGLRKSMNSQVSDYGGNLGDLAKVAMNLQPLLDNAVLIEVHPDKAKGTAKENAQLLQTYVLLSAYAEGDTITPVQFEVKQYVDDQNRLYLAVAMTKIKTGVMGDTILDKFQASTRLLPVSDISISRLIENINPSDENFFKYVPDQMLTDAQCNAKRRALEKEAKKYGKTLDEILEERGEIEPETELDKYCPLAKQRNMENGAYEAQSVSARVTNKVSEFLMKPIGKVDRLVIESLWGACQVEVEKKSGEKIGTEENKQAAGKLLEKVILETQQNALATERSSAMRSTSEVQKTLTMFSADAMKTLGRVLDSFGEYWMIRMQLKQKDLPADVRKTLEERRPEALKRFKRSLVVITSSAVFMAAVALAFRALLAQDEDKEPEEIARDVFVDGVGNLLGGLPLIRDGYNFIFEGYEMDSYLFSTFNDLMSAVTDSTSIMGDFLGGKEISTQEIARAVRKVFYSAGQLLGIPTRNVYKYTTGLTNRFFPEAGYAIDSVFDAKSYRADLKKAIEAGDTRMIARIAEVATNENYGIYSDTTRTELQKLVAAGYTVFPRTVGETVTVDGQTVELTSAQKTRFEKVYRISDRAVEELVSLKQFKEATEKERATALKYIYDTYYSIALDDLLGTDTEEKRVLFAEILDIEKLAMIVSHVSTLTADKDKDGKTVSGSRKNKIVAYVSKLNLTAAEKYAVMGYLGYTNVNGKSQVSSMINRTKLSREEKEKLLAYCGYAA